MGFEFRRPLGLFLSGGGALGSWQAGFLACLVKAGLEFDRILGFSAGALSGAGYCLRRMDELEQRWKNSDDNNILRFGPRLQPPTLFSDAGVWAAVVNAGDQAAARAAARCELFVVSYRVEEQARVYSRFTPQGARGWDGPLDARLVASCAIPMIFPPQRISEGEKTFTYVDGGVRGREPMRCDLLEGCKDVIAVEMIRAEEIGRRRWNPIAQRDQRGREVLRAHMDAGIESLRRLPEPPRVFRAAPSRVLDFSMLAFKSKTCAPALDLGVRDGESFLRSPGRFGLNGAYSPA